MFTKISFPISLVLGASFAQQWEYIFVIRVFIIFTIICILFNIGNRAQADGSFHSVSNIFEGYSFAPDGHLVQLFTDDSPDAGYTFQGSTQIGDTGSSALSTPDFFVHRSFEFYVTLNQAYAYTAYRPSYNVSGAPSGAAGYLPAGIYHFSADDGYSGASYDMALQLTQASTAIDQVLTRNDSTPILSPGKILPLLVEADLNRAGIQSVFSPNVTGLQDKTLHGAAQALDPKGDHFNWRQAIISVPGEWGIVINGVIVKQSDSFGSGHQVAVDITDPPGRVSGLHQKTIFNPVSGQSQNIGFSDPFDNTNGKDVYNDFYIQQQAGKAALEWNDSPHWNPLILLPGEAVGFRTELVLEDQFDNDLQVIGAPIYWYATQTLTSTNDHMGRESTSIYDPTLEAATGGSIFLGEVPVPEPTSFLLLASGAAGLIRRPHRKPSAHRLSLSD